MNEIIELLKLSPGLGITLGFIFAAFIAWLFKDLIVLYVKKKYDLFDIQEIRNAISANTIEIGKENEINTLMDATIVRLKNNRINQK